MKNLRHKINTSQIVVLFFILAIACKEETQELSLSRQFSPSKITSVNGETQVTLTWANSLFTTLGDVSYAIEISDNAADFTNPVIKATVPTAGAPSNTTAISVIVTDDKLAIRKDYYARVKAIGSEDVADSNWLLSSAFRILGEQYLLTVTTDNVIDTGVRLYWKPGNDLTKIVVTPATGAPIEVALTDADRTATFKIINGLTQNTSYNAEIFGGTKTKGIQPFKTVRSITGNIVDLSGTTGNPGILATTIASAASGSVIVLRRGEPYNIATAVTLSKSVTILSKLDFGTNYATLRMGNNFNVAAGTIDSLIFRDLVIKGTQAALAANAGYLINASNAGATVGKVRLENCSLKILRGVVRGQAGSTSIAGIKYNNVFINKCLMDSIRDFGVIAASGGSAVANFSMTNTTIYRARKFFIHAVAGNSSIAIDNCTFNELVSGTAAPAANYFIDFGASPNTQNSTNGITIKNSIFGAVWNETNAGTVIDGIRKGSSTPVNVATSYYTSDFVNNGASPIPDLSSYSGTSTTLFADPANGNFKIKDATFVGKASAGDPRWR